MPGVMVAAIVRAPLGASPGNPVPLGLASFEASQSRRLKASQVLAGTPFALIELVAFKKEACARSMTSRSSNPRFYSRKDPVGRRDRGKGGDYSAVMATITSKEVTATTRFGAGPATMN